MLVLGIRHNIKNPDEFKASVKKTFTSPKRIIAFFVMLAILGVLLWILINMLV